MTLATALGATLLGLLLLAGGGEALVRGAVALARRAGLTPSVIGLTVVAMGTSLPELVVSLLAAGEGKPDLAVGNAVGSNIFNLAVILGLTALVAPVQVNASAARREWPFMMLVSCLLVLLSRDGQLSRLEGSFMVLGMAAFTWFMVRQSRDVPARTISQARSRPDQTDSLGVALLAVAAGVTLLVLGGKSLVSGAVDLARLGGLSERVIGLTIVAAGTSMPELAASVIASRRGHNELALANLVGSNIFNILGILGLSAIQSPLVVSPGLLNGDMIWMMVVAFALFPLMRTGGRISRLEGSLLLTLYGAYLVVLLH